MATSTVIAQLIKYDSSENQIVVNMKTVGDAVSIAKPEGSKIPDSATNLQLLANALGSMAFSNGYSAATTSAAGLMSAADKSKLDGIAANANKYSHPTYTAKSSGFYKVTVDGTGHVSAVTSVTQADITALSIATTAVATTSANGLMSKGDKSKLDGIATGANNYSHPTSGVTAGTYRSVTVNAQGHVTAGSNPTTLSGYGITDAAAKSHTHASGDITSLDASKLTGTIDIARLPAGALERCVVVADDTARLALTTSDVQKGDTVKVTGTGKMYFVVDDSKLNAEAGYEVYTAGSATSVPWSGVTGKPSTYTPSTHTHTIADVTNLQSTLDGKAANTDMKASTTSAAGTHGLVPAPSAGAATRYLRCDGTWVTPPNTTYNAASQSSAGLMSAADKKKLDGIASGANAYSHPTYTAQASGLYKITVDATGHVSAVTAVAKSDITALGIPSTNTTYGVATTSANGLMSKDDKSKLDGIAANANNYTHPTSAGNKHIPSGGAAGQFLKYSASGTAAWADLFVIQADTPTAACMWLKTDA